MLSPDDFVARWGKDCRLIRFQKKTLSGLAIADTDKVFLTSAGLPKSAAPFLEFELPESGLVPTVADTWKQPDSLRRFRVIGFDGSGNPIAIDENCHGEIVVLDHENKFKRVLMNTSIAQLAESLLAYRNMIKDAQAINVEDAFLDGKIPAETRRALELELQRIDPAAVKPGGFWHTELKNLDANAS